MTPSIPVVRFADYVSGTPAERARFVRAFGEGLCEFGFVTLDAHEVPRDHIDRVFDVTARLFDLPLDDKRRFLRPAIGRARGYTEFGREKAVGAAASDLKEFWHVGQELSEVPADLARRYPENVWPDELLPAFRPAVRALYADFERCALSLLAATAEFLGLPPTHFADMARGGNSVLRLIHYPEVAPDAPPQAVRAAAHEDINLITLLVEATSGGLELLTRDGRWLPIASLAGQIVVDAGDMLQRSTNGVIPATTHRVVNPAGVTGPRYSIPFFTHPRPECVLAPAPGTVTPGRPARFGPPVTAHQFLVERLRANGVFDGDPMAQIG